MGCTPRPPLCTPLLPGEEGEERKEIGRDEWRGEKGGKREEEGRWEWERREEKKS